VVAVRWGGDTVYLPEVGVKLQNHQDRPSVSGGLKPGLLILEEMKGFD